MLIKIIIVELFKKMTYYHKLIKKIKFKWNVSVNVSFLDVAFENIFLCSFKFFKAFPLVYYLFEKLIFLSFFKFLIAFFLAFFHLLKNFNFHYFIKFI